MMHEEHHKSKSFGKDTFSRFAQKHGITASLEPIDRYGLMPGNKLKEAKNFHVTLSMGQRMMNFTISFPDYRKHLPPVEDVLEYMANEVAIYEAFGNDAQAFAEATGDSLEEAARDVSEASSAAEIIHVFLGPAIYKEIFSITEPRGRLPM